MKIVMILPPSGSEAALNEIGQFLTRSGISASQPEGWLLPEAEFSQQQLEAMCEQYARTPADILLFPSGWQGAELATRLAHRLQGDAWCAVAEADFADRWVSKSAYGGALVATLRLQNRPWCLSVAAAPGAGRWRPDTDFLPLSSAEQKPDWLVESRAISEETPYGLAAAKFVLAVGRGVGNQQAMAQVEAFANASGMEIGASREAVMHAWCSMDKLLGMSGSQVAAEVCIAAGVSGAPAFISGIADSQFIVAINSDPQAAIFRHADVGIVGELLPVLAELSDCVREDI